MAKKKITKSDRIRAYAQEWPDEFESYTPIAIASEIGGDVTAGDVSNLKQRMK